MSEGGRQAGRGRYKDTGGGGGGVSSFGSWDYRTDTGAADPGSGRFRFNNAAPSSATQIYIDDLNKSGVDTSVLWNNLISSGDHFYLQETGDADTAYIFEITGVTDNTGWFTLDVVFKQESPLQNLTQNDEVSFVHLSQSAGLGPPALHAPTHHQAGTDPLDVEALQTASPVGSFFRSDGAAGVDATQDLIPGADNTFDVGSGAARWKEMNARRGLFLKDNSLGGANNVNIDANQFGAVSGYTYNSGAGHTANLNVYGAAGSGLMAGTVDASGSGTSTATAEINGPAAFVLGESKAINGGTSVLQSTDVGALAGGYSYGRALTGTIQSTAKGCVSWGFAKGGDNGTATIEATQTGSFAQGYAGRGNFVGSGQNSRIRAFSRGSFAQGAARCSGNGAADIESFGYGSFAQGYAGTQGALSGVVSAGNRGSFAQGFAKGISINSTGIGAFAQGYGGFINVPTNQIQSAGAGSFAQGGLLLGGTITSISVGSFAQGGTIFGGTIRSANQGTFAQGETFGFGYINANQPGNFAQGWASGATATIQATTGSGAFCQGGANGGALLASGSGAFSQGFVTTSGSQVTASGGGSFAQGNANGAGSTIIASGTGSMAKGTATVGGDILSSGQGTVAIGQAASGSINASGFGTFAMGSCATGGGVITASTGGSFAQGRAASPITASAYGAFAQGFSNTAGQIVSTANGAFAQGMNANAGQINSTALGSFAQGYADATNIVASGGGSFAHGYAATNAITASYLGAFAVGYSGPGAITAGAINATQFGPGVNNRADVLKVGTAGLSFKGTAGAPAGLVNGDHWINGNYVELRSDGVTMTFDQSPAWSITNPVVRRTFDTTTVTLQQLAEAVGTITADLQNMNFFA